MSVSSEVQRTLVKSPPELWAELSDPATLARHLAELGEIRITGTDPERLVDWEATSADGAAVNGRVEIEPSGWGTRVTLFASRVAVEPEPEPEPEPVEAMLESEPALEIVEPEPRPRFFARLFRRRKVPPPEPEPTATVEIEEPAIAEQPDEPAPDIAAELAELEEQTTAVLTGVLDRLGAAHHRPFSRA